MADELVLTFPRRLLDDIGAFQGLTTHVARYVPRILEREHTRYLARSDAEHDPSHKQIIPYVLVRSGGAYLHYVRGKASGEKRLVALGSIGIGGHINDRDEGLFDGGLDYYDHAVRRELREELRIDGPFALPIVALINDDETPVGQVHFGIVHLCELADPSVARGEACITAIEFLAPDALRTRRDRMESWSRLCVDHLLDETARGCDECQP